MKRICISCLIVALCLPTILPAGASAQVVSNIPDLILKIDGLSLTTKQKQTLERDLSLNTFNKRIQSYLKSHTLDSLTASELLDSAAVICPDVATVTSEAGRGASVRWQIQPFPTNSDWPGWQGHPCLIEGGTLIMEGRPARAVENFSQPATVSLDILLDERAGDDGFLQVRFLKVGQPANLDPTDGTTLSIIYRNPAAGTGGDVLRIDQLTGGVTTTLWGEIPFTVVAGTVYHLRLTVASSGLTFTLNGQTYNPGITVPYSTFQVQLGAWQPMNRWFVNNFSVR
jgi:hypothetical protein